MHDRPPSLLYLSHHSPSSPSPQHLFHLFSLLSASQLVLSSFYSLLFPSGRPTESSSSVPAPLVSVGSVSSSLENPSGPLLRAASRFLILLASVSTCLLEARAKIVGKLDSPAHVASVRRDHCWGGVGCRAENSYPTPRVVPPFQGVDRWPELPPSFTCAV